MHIRKEATGKMLDWYIEILRQMPESKDLLYDFEADYQNDFSEFLINTADNVSTQKESLKLLISFAQDYRDKVIKSINEQQKLYNILTSALDSRICNIIEDYTMDISGTYESIRVNFSGLEANSAASIHFSLVDDGYLPTLLICRQVRIDMSEMSINEVLIRLREYILR